MTDPAPGRAVVLYDGDCAFCQRTVAVLKKLDWLGRLHFQSCRDAGTLPPCGDPLVMERMLDEMHLVPPDRKRAHIGFNAFRWMAWRMPPTWLLAPFLYLPGAPWAGDKVYRWVARHRYQLVPCQDGACRVPLKKSS